MPLFRFLDYHILRVTFCVSASLRALFFIRRIQPVTLPAFAHFHKLESGLEPMRIRYNPRTVNQMSSPCN
jgi:hypothetical protein